MREWDAGSGEISLATAGDRRGKAAARPHTPGPHAILGGLPSGCDALVLSENERASCAHLIAEAAGRRAPSSR